MAIQINGTTVVNNSRQLQNIGSIDSTTATAINNAGIGGSATWQTIATVADSTERTSAYQSSFTQITMPTSAVKGFGVVVDCDGKLTSAPGSGTWTMHVAVSTNNSWTANGGIGTQAEFSNARSTSGYWPAVNQYQNIQFVGAIGIDSESLKPDYSAGYATAVKPKGRNISLTTNTNPASNLSRVTWDGDYWGGYSLSNFTDNDAPTLTTSSTFYTSWWFDRFSQGSVAIRNVSIKFIGLY